MKVAPKHSDSRVIICHTPLHVLISRLMEEDKYETDLVVVNDAAGLHDFARGLLGAPRLHLLPGAADTLNRFDYAQLRRSNADYIASTFSASRSICFFNDLLPEAQALLNKRRPGDEKTRFICLEDGVALYPVGGVTPPSWPMKIWKKAVFGMRWKHLARIATHPAITEIRCFHPDLVREDLRIKVVKQLSCDTRGIAALFVAPELTESMHSTTKYVAVACPHSTTTSRERIQRFAADVRTYCRAMNTKPLFKPHPRDPAIHSLLREFCSDASILPRDYPLELAPLLNSNIVGMIGTRTSALHISKVLMPALDCRYVELDHDEATPAWEEFFRQVGVPSLDVTEQAARLLPAGAFLQ